MWSPKVLCLHLCQLWPYDWHCLRPIRLQSTSAGARLGDGRSKAEQGDGVKPKEQTGADKQKREGGTTAGGQSQRQGTMWKKQEQANYETHTLAEWEALPRCMSIPTGISYPLVQWINCWWFCVGAPYWLWFVLLYLPHGCVVKLPVVWKGEERCQLMPREAIVGSVNDKGPAGIRKTPCSNWEMDFRIATASVFFSVFLLL